MVPLAAADGPWREATASVCTRRFPQSGRGPPGMPGMGTGGSLLWAPLSPALQCGEADGGAERCPHPAHPGRAREMPQRSSAPPFRRALPAPLKSLPGGRAGGSEQSSSAAIGCLDGAPEPSSF